MTHRIDNGGPAFPFAAEYGHPAACGGMTLRDWFAGQALAGMMANGLGQSATRHAYDMADAMIAARNEVSA